MLEIVKTPHGSAHQKDAVDLRRRVLRQPLGLDFTADELAREGGDEHWVAVRDGRVVGCLVVVPLADREAKIRQVAVDPGLQRIGIGRTLIEAVECDLRLRGTRSVMLHARREVVAWYESQGYESFGEPFFEVTIPHRAMRKDL